jgi:hypothetical protein
MESGPAFAFDRGKSREFYHRSADRSVCLGDGRKAGAIGDNDGLLLLFLSIRTSMLQYPAQSVIAV